MKFNLVVAQGVHAGKKIPVNAASEFVIGREASCQLRPASPSISKQHCGISLRGEQAFVRDCGSTNGTFVNEEQVAGERELHDGDKLRVGPLEFTVSMEGVLIVAAKPASVTETVSAKINETIMEVKPVVVPAPVASADSDDPEQMAALLLGFDDGSAGGTPTVENFNPDSTTVMEMPALGAAKAAQEPKKEEKKKTHGDSSSAAAEALSKYMRRPRT